MKVGLRVDADTFRGTRYGVPELIKTMAKHGVHASYFFSVGPDNMGRHLWRLLKPKFMLKMFQSNAIALYGFDIIFRGIFFPGRLIAENNQEVIRECKNCGHEIGIHSWDHQYWQAHTESMNEEEIFNRLSKVDTLSDILGEVPDCSAAAGFRTTDAMLKAKERFGFRYNSDCRGNGIFLPVVDDKVLDIPQIPFSTPTYDEVIGRNRISNKNYNEFILSKLQKDGDVLTIHAEVEGGRCSGIFDEFLTEAEKRGIEFCPLGKLLDVLLAKGEKIPAKKIVRMEIPGRESWISTVG